MSWVGWEEKGKGTTHPPPTEAGPRSFQESSTGPQILHPLLSGPERVRGSHLSDEEPANLLVIPAEGTVELMVSCGESAFVAGAATCVGG